MGAVTPARQRAERPGTIEKASSGLFIKTVKPHANFSSVARRTRGIRRPLVGDDSGMELNGIAMCEMDHKDKES